MISIIQMNIYIKLGPWIAILETHLETLSKILEATEGSPRGEGEDPS